MVWSALLTRAATTVATGAVGVAAVEGARRAWNEGALRSGAVSVTAWGLRGARAAEAGAERVRLGAADLVAQARERNGEQAPAPRAAAEPHDHEH